jgi:hypothetical protein
MFEAWVITIVDNVLYIFERLLRLSKIVSEYEPVMCHLRQL